MVTMKIAFEAKLRLAKEEVEAISKKHQLEIQRLQQQPRLTPPLVMQPR